MPCVCLDSCYGIWVDYSLASNSCMKLSKRWRYDFDILMQLPISRVWTDGWMDVCIVCVCVCARLCVCMYVWIDRLLTRTYVCYSIMDMLFLNKWALTQQSFFITGRVLNIQQLEMNSQKFSTDQKHIDVMKTFYWSISYSGLSIVLQ